MIINNNVSKQTKDNWLIDSFLAVSAVLASISGIYFLFFPVGGYQGGRNPYFGVHILFERHTWGDIHTWTGVMMIAILLVHIPLHWHWVVNMTRRTLRELFSRDRNLNPRSRFNVFINLMVGISFILTALSGIYLLFVPGGPQSTINSAFLFGRTTWDLIHTWAGAALVIAGLVHFAIHWKWVVKVTRKIFMPAPRHAAEEQVAL